MELSNLIVNPLQTWSFLRVVKLHILVKKELTFLIFTENDVEHYGGYESFVWYEKSGSLDILRKLGLMSCLDSTQGYLVIA